MERENISLRIDVSVFGHSVFEIIIACFISYSLVCLSIFPNWRGKNVLKSNRKLRLGVPLLKYLLRVQINQINFVNRILIF